MASMQVPLGIPKSKSIQHKQDTDNKVTSKTVDVKGAEKDLQKLL